MQMSCQIVGNTFFTSLEINNLHNITPAVYKTPSVAYPTDLTFFHRPVKFFSYLMCKMVSGFLVFFVLCASQNLTELVRKKCIVVQCKRGIHLMKTFLKYFQGEFVDGGTETHFKLHNKYNAYIKAISSGKRRSGIIHTLFVEDQEIPETEMDVQD